MAARVAGGFTPTLEEGCSGGLRFDHDPVLRRLHGIEVAFTQRAGGVSAPPFESLNLGAHVGDDPIAVDRNRTLLLASLDLSDMGHRVVTAEQVHGDTVTEVSENDAGSGASARGGPPPLSATDGLVTGVTDVPLLMLYADCVPVVVVALRPRRAVAVVHSGWKGTLSRIAARGVERVAALSRSAPEDMCAYIGPSIGRCCYNVDATRASHFCNEFDTITAVDGHLDLGRAVRRTLRDAGVPDAMIAEVGSCTSDRSDRYFSYRVRPETGRHGALAVITKA